MLVVQISKDYTNILDKFCNLILNIAVSICSLKKILTILQKFPSSDAVIQVSAFVLSRFTYYNTLFSSLTK